jgi:hypothetical protein
MGNAQTETRDCELGHEKDQSLFLRGFLLTPSQSYLKNLKSGVKVHTPERSKPGMSTGKPLGESPVRKEPGAMGEGGAADGHTVAGDYRGPSSQAKVLVHALPPQRCPVDYPLYRINTAILHQVSLGVRFVLA